MRATCGYCGKDLGYEKRGNDFPDSCGSTECERNLRSLYEEDLAQARDRAEYDEYERYR